MPMKPKPPRQISPNLIGLSLAVVLVTGAVFAFGGLSPDNVAIPAAIMADLATGVLRTGLALLSFSIGLALATVLILRPIRNAYRAREAQLERRQKQLEALTIKLHRQATSDGLLGIANRREFERVLTLEWRRAARERQSLSLLMIDVDHFKIYNDTYGHLEGDDCLKHVAAVLEETTGRPGDLVARYGGEEMAILMPRTELEGAMHIAERIHVMLAGRALPFHASPVASHVTVSIGAASLLPVRNIEPHLLIQQADEGLYAAKENGRNRTEAIRRLRLIASMENKSKGVETAKAYRA
ncbi:diguanylate cyclase [Billgrantia endophytica]|uniref:diguanylate cyclase n=1 Tax=Billgrantia endophytica TaxID=2033802 RepID=A0A2N7U7L1_9GAMM|nr:diguanylate cyclase [Halomonas endophytica]PMR76427.1 hypothetical protein C1H69_05095 [Halomonas endophytica]